MARRIITLFPFEAEIYRRLGADAVCAGHPLVDDVREGLARPSPLPREDAQAAGSPAREPDAESSGATGRRCSAAAARLARRFDLEVVAVRAPGLPQELFAGAESAGVTVVPEGMHALLATADLAFVASGTATLEAALCGAPMVVVYRMSRSSWRDRAAARARAVGLACRTSSRRRRSFRSCSRTTSRLTGWSAKGRRSWYRRNGSPRMHAGLARVAARAGTSWSERARGRTDRCSRPLRVDEAAAGACSAISSATGSALVLALLAMGVVALATVAMLFLLKQGRGRRARARGRRRRVPGLGSAGSRPPLLAALERVVQRSAWTRPGARASMCAGPCRCCSSLASLVEERLLVRLGARAQQDRPRDGPGPAAGRLPQAPRPVLALSTRRSRRAIS